MRWILLLVLALTSSLSAQSLLIGPGSQLPGFDHVGEAQPYKCWRCGLWFARSGSLPTICAVAHPPGTCCHFGETALGIRAGVYPAEQPAPATISAPTAAVTVTVTISAADALLVHAAVAPPHTPIPLDAKGQPLYTTLAGAVQHQLSAVVQGWVTVGRRAKIEQLAADVLALELADRDAIEAEIKKRKKEKK